MIAKIKKISYSVISVLSVMLVLALGTLYTPDGDEVKLKFNFLALIILGVALVLLVLVERKFGYFAWIWARIKREVTYFSENREKIVAIVIHAVALLTTAAFAVTIGILMTIGHYNRHTFIAAFVLCIIAVVFQLIDRIFFREDRTAAKVFLVIAVLIGVMMCYTLPAVTWITWDDGTHLKQAYTVLHPFADEISVAEHKLFGPSASYSSEVYNYGEHFNDPVELKNWLIRHDAISYDRATSWVSPYTALGYLPIVGTMLVAELVNMDIVTMLVLCRMATMLAFVAIVYAGMRKLRNGVCLMAAIALVPGVFYLSCSYSYDPWLTAWIAYGFAYIISEFQQPDKKIRTLDLVKILLAFFIGCGPKPVYCLLMLPLLFLNSSKFEKPKHVKIFRICTVIAIVAVVAIIIILGFANNFYTDNRGGDDVDTILQLKYILQNPLEYAKLLLSRMGNYFSFGWFNDFGVAYGYMSNTNPETCLFFGTFAGFLILYCVFTDRKENDCYEDMQRLRWLTFVTCIIQFAVLITSMYLVFTPVGADKVNGYQFRYIYPLLFPFFFFLAPKGIKANIDQKLHHTLVFGGLAFNLLMGYWDVFVERLF